MKIQLAAVAAPIALASVLAFAPTTSSAGYLTSSSGELVTSGYGLCWQGVWPNPDKADQCGDKTAPEPMMAEGDADNDGIVDSKDECPGTPSNMTVDYKGCPADSDGDGVLDVDDRCPGSAIGAKVNGEGCEIIANVTINLVNDEFDFDSAKLKDMMKSALDAVIAKIKGTAGAEQLDIVGYTDTSGPEAYNQALSERRAQSVADYMSANGIDAANMTVSGKGEADPVADNSTRDGRKKNRRVEINSH